MAVEMSIRLKAPFYLDIKIKKEIVFRDDNTN